jgi:hypothetical protein
MSHHQDKTNDADIDEVQAKAIAKALDVNSQRLNMRTLSRLEESRALAVRAHAGKISGQQFNIDGTLSGRHFFANHLRMLSLGFLSAMLVVGLAVTYHINKQADNNIDAFLLGAELPPEAFVDRGFEPWLNAKADL